MTSHIDRLLSRARLVPRPYTVEELEAAEVRLIARMVGADPDPEPTATGPAAPEEQEAAQDLQTLCETVVARTALETLGDFMTQSMPEPPGARVLGCMLQLRDSEHARFWWQYAAGAGDAAASYCLYLHHRALGEIGAARTWYTWHTETRRAKDPAPAAGGTSASTTAPVCKTTATETKVPAAVHAALTQASRETTLPTTLRILKSLKKKKEKETWEVSGASRVSETLLAVMDYVPAAVSYVDADVDLPLPDRDFTDRIRTLTAGHHTECAAGTTTDPLPARPQAAASRIAQARRHPRLCC